ncbi:hypothetical protein WJX74_005378 [Apatococcus lobatus]|uniref:Uncharacterized protein n=1 Tax=Apatococcus lobatus TaxID=904363 RepID=A0AAW1QUV3_9CHLO
MEAEASKIEHALLRRLKEVAGDGGRQGDIMILTAKEPEDPVSDIYESRSRSNMRCRHKRSHSAASSPYSGAESISAQMETASILRSKAPAVT